MGELIQLKYSKHARERLEERTTGSLILAPKWIRLTEENTIERIEKDGRIVAATAFIEYKRGVNMYLPIAIADGVVKTVYFKNVKTNTIKKRNETPEQGDKGTEKSETVLYDHFGGLTQNVEYVSRNMGRKKTDRWKRILRVIRKKSW